MSVQTEILIERISAIDTQLSGNLDDQRRLDLLNEKQALTVQLATANKSLMENKQLLKG